MSLESIIFIVLGTLLLAAIGACVYFGKDYLYYHKIFSPILTVLFTCIKSISGMMPNNKTLGILSIVLNASMEATALAERLWLDGALDKEQRNIYAKNYISVVLEKAGVDITENINNIVDGVIAFVCYLLPHGQTPKEDVEEEA